ncbi:T9SS type A sorting domain-containing protein [Fluviicola taffensis]|uniref:T9SS type A sorting domain-containing protein n=1 Tax=Fluviicola taffensis TaxID=191579 RepID=UPI003137DCE4
MKTLLSALLLLLGTSYLSAQTDLSFDIRYSLQTDFAGSGTEKNHFAELQNGKILQYRFEADSLFGIKHFMRIWCVDKIGNTQWDRKFSIGEGDSVWLSASLKSTGNQTYLVYSHIDQSRKSSLRLMHFGEDGTVLSAHKLDIPNEPQVRNIRSLIRNQELVVSFDFLAADSSRSAGFGKIPFGNINSATWFHTNDLQKSTTLYEDANNEIHFIATKDTNAVDMSLDQIGVYQAIQFPAKFLPESAMVFNGNTYYTGNIISGIFLNSILHKLENNQPSGWVKRLNLVGPSPPNYGSNSSGILSVNGKILVLGYGTVPHPLTYLSVFEENGALVKTETFDAFHSFNYNRGDLFKHSSGALFFSKLAGIWTGTQFATVLERIDTTNYTSCNSETANYAYVDTIIQHTTTTVSFTPENYTFSPLSLTMLQDSLTSEITCHTNLSLDENKELSLEAYPNPFSGNFILRSIQLNEVTIQCYDLMGKEILIEKTVLDDQQIQLTPPIDFTGSLFLRVQTVDGYKQTILVQRMK